MPLSAPSSTKSNTEQIRVLRLKELDGGFQALSDEIHYHPDADKAPHSLYSKTRHNAYLLERFTDGLDSSTPLPDTLASGLVMSLPFNENLSLFVGYTFKGDESFDKHGPILGFEGMLAEEIKRFPMNHPRLKGWLIDRPLVSLSNVALVKTVRTTNWVDVSLHKATLHASETITAQTLEQCALAENDFIECFMRGTLATICHPVAMIDVPGERDGFMLPSTAETVGHILQEVLKNSEASQPASSITDANIDSNAESRNASPRSVLCPLSGLTLQSRENFHQSLSSMAKTLHRSVPDCKSMLIEAAKNPSPVGESTAFGAYMRGLEQLFKKHLPEHNLDECFPVSSLTALAKGLPDGHQKAGLSSYLNSPVESLRLVEMRRDLNKDDNAIKLVMVNITDPTVYLVDKANNTDLDESSSALDSKKFKPNLVFDNAASALENCSDINSIEGDAHNPYRVQSGLGFSAQQWLDALRGV